MVMGMMYALVVDGVSVCFQDGVFPVMGIQDWCGEYQPREEQGE